jgi:DNA polymerase III alpha subunit
MCSVINNFGGYYRSWVYFAEARRLGAEICTPCINDGAYLTSLHGTRLVVGFIHVKSMEEKYIKHILRERNVGGNFKGIYDFTERVSLNREQIILLIRVGAFAFTGKSKPELLWELFGKSQKNTPDPDRKQLFSVAVEERQLPDLHAGKLEDAYDEMELIGFPVSISWFDILQTSFRGEIMSIEMKENLGRRCRMLGVLLTIKPVRTKKNELMYFASFMDVAGHFFEAVHFPQSLKQYPFRGNGTYLLFGKIVNDFGATSMEVEKMAKMELKSDPRG